MRLATGIGAVLAACGLALGAVTGPPKAPPEDLPGDRPRSRSELIEDSPHEYEIVFRGTVDGVMTRSPIGYAAFQQGWQPNRSVLVENVGPTDVANPRLVVNGKRDWRSLADVVAEATAGWERDADRARAIWEFRRRTRFHATTWDDECSDAVKSLNVYGYTLCGNEARVLNDLWKAAGLTTRRGYPVGHVVTEVFYDGDYHLLDSDEHVICLERDNRTIASEAEIVRDHDLVKRTHTYGIGRRDSRRTDEFSASLYGYEGERAGDFGTHTRHVMRLTLRPGESIEYRWDHVGKQYTAGQPRAAGEARRDGLGDLREWGPTAYRNLCNGKLRYRPDLGSEAAERGAALCDNVRFDRAARAIRVVRAAQPAAVVWRFASPYVFVGGRAVARVRLDDGAAARWWCDAGGRWTLAAEASGPGERELAAVLDELISPRGRPDYAFQLKLELAGGAVVSHVAFEHDVQMAPLSLPELEVGRNRIVYRDDNTGARRVRVTHQWVERASWRPPAAPAAARSPKDGQTVAGSRVHFQWTPAEDPDGDRISDYHFELSEHADMRWPLSPNFEKLISRTPFKGQCEWAPPYVGLLNPDTDYYWRVRARDEHGVWGPWSRTFRFRVRGPGAPLDVTLEPSGDRGFVLRWRPNPQGSPPAAYKVYGSDERGFTASDTEYETYRGRGFVRTMEQYEAKSEDAPDAGVVRAPPNLIGLVRGESLRVIGPGLSRPNTNKAYYRVVAVDAEGVESGPSDYAEAPHPYVVNLPPDTARVGRPYRYRPRVIRSLGDLRCRRSGRSSYNAAFWDREELSFAPLRFPEGLRMDAVTGEISGRPTRPGRSKLAFQVSTQFGARCEVSVEVDVR